MATPSSTRSRTVVLVAVSLAGAAAAALAALELSRRRARARARRAARGPARVAELRVHPVKSAGACLVDSAEVTRFGLRHDRAFAIVDEQTDEIQTQRKIPKLAVLKPKLSETELMLTAPGMSELAVPLCSDKLEQCTVHKIGSVALDMVCWRYGAEASAWLSRALDRASLYLVRLEPSHALPGALPGTDHARPRLLREQMAGEAAGANDACAFHDWAPFLLASEESLSDLNRRLGPKAVGMDRFRANVVFEGGDLRPYEEDRWTVVRAGAVRFRCLESCVRCTVPTIDQETGERPDGQNPTALLRSYRTQTEDACGPYAKFGPVFGAWAVPDFVEEEDEASDSAVLRVGDLLTVEGTAALSSYDHWARRCPEARPGR